MRQTLTLLSILVAAAGTAGAQSSRFHLPGLYNTDAARATIAVRVGADAIQATQRGSGAAAKTTSTAYRLRGWSRFDATNNEYVDSTTSSYSKTRGSRFADEKENLHGGDWWTLSSPDRFYTSRDGGPDGATEVVQKYNSRDQVTEQIYRSSGFSSKSVSTYNPSGQLANMVEFDSSSAGWIASRRFTYTYDAAGRRVSDNVFDLQGGVPLGAVTYHYDAAGRQDTMQSQVWDGMVWFTDYLLVNSFNAAGLTQATTNYYIDEDRDLLPGERLEYTYDASSRLATSITSVFDDGSWHLQLRDSFGYTGTKALYTFMRSELWDEDLNSWNAIREWSYSLNAQLRWGVEWFKTPGNSGALEYQTKTLISYNAAGNVSETKSYTYDRQQQLFGQNTSEEEHFWYEDFETTGVPVSKMLSEVAISPNPATSSIRLESNGRKILRIDVYSISGRRMLSQQGAAPLIDVSALPAGPYILNTQLEGAFSAPPVRFVKLQAE